MKQLTSEVTKRLSEERPGTPGASLSREGSHYVIHFGTYQAPLSLPEPHGLLGERMVYRNFIREQVRRVLDGLLCHENVT